MAKTKTSFTLTSEAIDLLKQLAERFERSQANMLEVLIKEAASREKIKVKK